MTYKPRYSCAVLNETTLKDVIETYGLENCYLGKLWSGFNATENEFLFSYAASRFQKFIKI